MQGMKCTNGHVFWERGGSLHFKEGDVRANFSAEMADDYLPQLLEAWLSDYKWTAPYVHPQLRQVLERFREGYRNITL